MYAKIINNQVVAFPFNLGTLRREVTLPHNPSAADLAQHGVYAVTTLPAPDFDPITHGVEPGAVYFDGSKALRQMRVVELDAETVAANQAAALEKLKAIIVDATQKRLDDFAKLKGYDGILSACTYATSTKPTFAAEGQWCVEARDNTWAALYSILAEVQAGTRAVPTGFADIEADLPVLAWPS